MSNLNHDANEQHLQVPYPYSYNNESPSLTPQSSCQSGINIIMKPSAMKRTQSPSRNPPKSFRTYMTRELDEAWMSTIIIICFFTSGLIDSVAFNSWSCFVGMQTGNTIFAALGLTGQPQATHRQQYYKSLVSIGSFCLGTLFFNFLHRYPNMGEQPRARRRFVFLLSFMVQTILIVVAAVLVTLGVVSNRPAIAGQFSSGSHTQAADSDESHFADLAPIAILAFEASGQVCLSRVLSVIELPTIVLSTLYHDFTGDLYGLVAAWGRSDSIFDFLFVEQRRQGKRLASIIALFLGGIVGGEMFKSVVGMSGALWAAAGLKLGICIGWLVWKREADSDEKQTLPQ